MINSLTLTNNTLLGLSVEELEQWAQDEGQHAFRGRQVYDWVYKKGVRDLDEISVLPKEWKHALRKKGVSIGRMRIVEKLEASDKTIKFLLETNDSEYVETVAIPTDKRLTVCVSSQIGCPMGCHFCATGKNGLRRSLQVNEILDQVLTVNEVFGRRSTNVVFMGMGEPLLNLDTVLNSIRCLNTDLGIGQRRITLSTVGVADTMPKLAERALDSLGRVQFTLAVSLHAPNQKLRETLIPSASQYPLKKLLEDCRHYFSITGRRVSFEYILLGQLNDKPEHAKQLVELLSGFQSHVNLIPYNPIEDEDFQRPTMKNMNRFKNYLQTRGIAVSFRSSRGLDQNAACGQLRRRQESIH
ncbi:23S rRNA (adenine(2503)-C(2))-methyltransferase RlmN [Prochlorococcus sp. MIT 1223]|uniref:23S rRNA (adenine(2503)-C(2))-methyltransferase RlmN n=1 Tax=Prochlorococcus sp. MIT 1223 TaxID=3096217 RepID=UPI002A74B917|nr:23S rRNA (adenine(2503)-C(2))-methyltransferase RlmN [Prochlorococcus sp. MIT 1223]